MDTFQLQVYLVALLDGFQASLFVLRLGESLQALASEENTLLFLHLLVDREELGSLLRSQIGFLGDISL